jgi:surfeit locus 1 family protein
MLARLKRAGILWPTLLSLAGLALLVGLGLWQLERKQWKEALLAKIAARATAAPITLTAAEALLRAGGDVEYLHVTARGHFLNDKERYLYAPTPAGLGWHVYTPLQVAPQRYLWVNRGFIPDDRKPPSTRALGLEAGELDVVGLVRAAPRKGTFQPNNDARGNLWYWPDLAAMSASAFPAGQALGFSLESDLNPAPPGGLPRGGVTRLDLPNRHLEYALTWFGLAVTLIGVYLAFAASRLHSATK